ncbi:MAG: NfeD family protein [Candidatus Marinimicrobia bacterium]|jgi:membrane protein implicated in regulation of membrane protease activity|nr:NfeD family protein [Candidatus Neomarinimicrobiota bacterium]MDD4961077.1 NfeD family protein [Candidatus Neomarinimicrobiota bacterium]MDD5709505.1 NfeD family protein [Candidatus Neomarinimicrobiota bacterium]MDX9777523.1 NfeD family protein [bacterium]
MEISSVLIWFLIGLAMMLLEFAIPGLIVIFFGAGAWVLAILTAIFPSMALWVQLMLFTVISVASLLLLRRQLKKHFFSDHEGAESEGLDDYIGRKAIVEKAFVKGEGKVLYRGTSWDAFADEDIPEGTPVRIIDKDSIRLKVEPIK